MVALNYYVSQLSEAAIQKLFKAAPLHDIGKIGIPDNILLKNGKLTDQEWEIMRSHTLIGEDVLSIKHDLEKANNEVISIGINIAGGHHEKWDGTGYPRGLKGEAIPLEARIMAVADMYDALITERVYKKAWSHEEAIYEITKKKGTSFDPVVIEAFLAEQENLKTIAQKYKD